MIPDHRRGLPQQLTAELARRNPEQYRKALFDQLGRQTTSTRQVWDYYKRQGTFDDQSLVLQPNTWVSETRRRPGTEKFDIRLGTGVMTPEEKHRFIFQEGRINDKVCLLSHEISHVLASDATSLEPVGKLYSTVTQMRGRGDGLSAIGGLDFYKSVGPEEQAKEDVVELFNMHLIDPAYLQEYLDFLSDPRFVAQRSQARVATIGAPVAQHIGRTVARSVDQLLAR